MSLLTAHKILIGSSVALFAGYAVSQLRQYLGGDPSAAVPAGLSGIAALGLAIYLRWVWVHRPGDEPRR